MKIIYYDKNFKSLCSIVKKLFIQKLIKKLKLNDDTHSEVFTMLK